MRRSIKEKQKELADNIFLLIIVIVVPLALGGIIWQMVQFHITLDTLTSLSSQKDIRLGIYPRTGRAVGTPRQFSSQDSLVYDFHHALADIQTYRSTPYDSLVSDDHLWFLEVTTQQGKVIQISCSIFVEKPGTVIGRLGKFHEKSTTYYGDFQSQQLFQWYQKYSHLWLESEVANQPQDASYEDGQSGANE